ncbi:MAG: hypothetical protein JWL85_389 [Candidatus Saccharibacteria bacterium]|nr:hypothetical protein [Candidatus Saccharibacteria bacterium]
MSYRTRKEEYRYKKYQQDRSKSNTTTCVFCDISTGDEQLISETPNFKIVKNMFGYSIWDNQPVADHLMILPKIHTDTLSSLSPDAAVEFVQLISNYESIGYNVYARAPQSLAKTVVHQHTHLIKTAPKYKQFVLYLQKPYVRIAK